MFRVVLSGKEPLLQVSTGLITLTNFGFSCDKPSFISMRVPFTVFQVCGLG